MNRYPHVKLFCDKETGLWRYDILDSNNNYAVIAERSDFEDFASAHGASQRHARRIYLERSAVTLEKLQRNQSDLIHQMLHAEARTVREVAQLLAPVSCSTEEWMQGFIDAAGRNPVEQSNTSYADGYVVGELYANHTDAGIPDDAF